MGEQFSPLDCMAKARVKGMFFHRLRRGDDTVGNPHQTQIYQFELFELILLLGEKPEREAALSTRPEVCPNARIARARRAFALPPFCAASQVWRYSAAASPRGREIGTKMATHAVNSHTNRARHFNVRVQIPESWLVSALAGQRVRYLGGTTCLTLLV